MSEKDILYKGKIKHNGVFNFKDFYSFLYEWITNEGYFINEKSYSVILEKDYEERWENQPFWKFMRGIYDRYIIRTRIEEYGKKAILELNELINQCKDFLELEAKVEQ